MDLRQLRYFIAIVEEKKITAAAKRLHIAQPPLSQQLKLMEQELGVQLIERSGKLLEVTEAGKMLYKHALHIIRYMEESQLEVQETGAGLRGKLTLGINTLSDARFAELLAAFRGKYPNISFKIQQNESDKLCQLVRERSIELAIVRYPLELSDFSVLHLKTEPYCFVTSAQEQVEGETISFPEIGSVPLILPSTEGLGVHQMIVDEFACCQVEPNVICECSDISLLLQLVSSGLGATIVPASVLQLHRGHAVRALKIVDTTLTATSVLIWLKDRYLSKGAQHFIDMLSSNSAFTDGRRG